ncbi:hypothetical protein PMIN01_07156 [Paraphaeosphaeria minitans]|uniref:Uncharacterized protein n=1 Tax=Paraphaeosphaeria minitans TaxID=565426 RepID=A0A9P6GFB1_9PLEO|nr:hypothetical protein PMIN01_07156 [Paraphaeosphaeria minitans]
MAHSIAGPKVVIEDPTDYALARCDKVGKVGAEGVKSRQRKICAHWVRAIGGSARPSIFCSAEVSEDVELCALYTNHHIHSLVFGTGLMAYLSKDGQIKDVSRLTMSRVPPPSPVRHKDPFAEE